MDECIECIDCGEELSQTEDHVCKAHKPHWFCESCGYKDEKKAMPSDRVMFYIRVDAKGSPKCPKCKSESFMPVGY